MARRVSSKPRRLIHLLGALAITALASPAPARAENATFSPQTKLRLTVVQWMPAKGQYERWEALGGEFVVSSTGTLTLPVVGAISVGKLDGGALADAIAQKIKDKIGLNERPNATIEIVEYPPIYVVGNVAKPGEYHYRVGLTALQALALGGGEPQDAAKAQQSQEEIKLISELQQIDEAVVRGNITLARLRAELLSAKTIAFDDVKTDDAPRAPEIISQEKIIFAARAGALDRQASSLTDLKELLGAEVNVLGQKIKDSDVNISTSEAQLKGIKALVDKGFSTTSRQLDLERALAGIKADRLDQLTATMRARQAISQTTRSLEALQDERRIEVAGAIQGQQAQLDELRLRREMTQKLLVNQLSTGAASKIAKGPLTFSIVRRGAGGVSETPATEATELMPGDVVKITRDSVEPPNPKLSELNSAGADRAVP